MNRISKIEGGFSLLEILLSVFVIGISVAAFVPASMNSRHAVAHARRMELALTAAGTVLDRERFAGYAALGVGTTPIPAAVTQPDLPNMSGAVKVSLVDANLAPTVTDMGRKRVDVTVAWDDKHRDSGTITLSSLVAND